MVKLGQIDNETFERLRAQLGIGGDLGSTHMVKGLDWELLRRVRAGEEVGGSPLPSGDGEGGEDKEGEGGEDPDEEFERVLEEKGKEVTVPKAREREEGKKKGSMAPPPVARSRDEILRQLKASREKAKIQTQTQTQDQDQEQEHAESLGTRFKRIGETKTKPEKKRFVETDETGRRREVLIITDAEGKTKRKVKWLDKPGETVKRNTGINTDTGLLVPGKDKRLGMEVPDFAKAEPEEEDDDIFEGAGDYNPLGELQDEESSDEESESKLEKTESPAEPVEKSTKSDAAGPVEPVEPAEPSKPRNYFTTSTGPREDRSKPLMKDPTLMAAFKRAASLRQAPTETDDGDQPGEETSQHRRNFLEEVRRREAQDAMDMDLGFGGSRIEDEEDDEAVLFEGEGRNKRKRGPKKRKGNKESVSDVMGVLQGRRQV